MIKTGRQNNKCDYGLRTQRGGRQRGILIRLAIAVVYDNRVQYSYSFCLICMLATLATLATQEAISDASCV